MFGGNLKSDRLGDVWNTSDLFIRIRERDALGGRCGACELQGLCGGCRARAYGTTGDLMAEDPLCTHVPGTFDAALLPAPALTYGRAESTEIVWDDDARERMKRIPVFVRGMVVRAVEKTCREKGIGRVTVAELDRIRAGVPERYRVFGRKRAD